MLRKIFGIFLILLLNFSLSFADSDLERLVTYGDNLGKALTINWHPPKKQFSYKVVVLFRINKKDGHFSNIRLQEPCTDKEACEAALFAVKETGAFKQNFLDELKEDYLDTDYSFIYNVTVKPASVQPVTSD